MYLKRLAPQVKQGKDLLKARKIELRPSMNKIFGKIHSKEAYSQKIWHLFPSIPGLKTYYMSQFPRT